MNKTALIRDCAVAADQDIICYSLSEDFNFEDIRYDLFSLPIYVGMYEGDMVITCNDIAESRKSFFYSLNSNFVGQ